MKYEKYEINTLASKHSNLQHSTRLHEIFVYLHLFKCSRLSFTFYLHSTKKLFHTYSDTAAASDSLRYRSVRAKSCSFAHSSKARHSMLQLRTAQRTKTLLRCFSCQSPFLSKPFHLLTQFHTQLHLIFSFKSTLPGPSQH